jgi:hypothetical protein
MGYSPLPRSIPGGFLWNMRTQWPQQNCQRTSEERITRVGKQTLQVCYANLSVRMFYPVGLFVLHQL